jgi:hypothetical protein
VTIHYHGTPITPREQLYKLAGRHFCVSFSDARDADVCAQIGQSVLYDNGAFSSFTRGAEVDESALHAWLDVRLAHPHRAIILDRIGGDVDEQRDMAARWPFARELSWPVWHLDKPLDYLLELSDGWSGLCLGSAGTYWQIGSDGWAHRMDEAFNHLARHRAILPWVHGLRMMAQVEGRWPLSSADSTNVARNHAGNTRGAPARCPATMAAAIDARQAPVRWTTQPIQQELVPCW